VANKVIVVGANTMGRPLISRLLAEGNEIACILSRNKPERLPPQAADIPWVSAPPALSEMQVLGFLLGPHLKDVRVAYLAIPSDGVGLIELAYILFFVTRGIYVVTFAKSALAYHYEKLIPYLHMIGRSATVGGRTLILPWLKMHRVRGKVVTMFVYLNASTNFFADDTGDGASPDESFLSTKNNHLAEPGSTDYVGFLNGEIGVDMPQKATIIMDDCLLPIDGPYMNAHAFGDYVSLGEKEVYNLTLPYKKPRYVMCFSNSKHAQPMFEPGKPGNLFAQFGGFTISGGFLDIAGNTHLSKWFKGGKANGIQVRFEGEHSSDGTVESAGAGAGLGTIGAAMNDMYDHLERTKLLPRSPTIEPPVGWHPGGSRSRGIGVGGGGGIEA